jgi:hypothetical protein
MSTSVRYKVEIMQRVSAPVDRWPVVGRGGIKLEVEGWKLKVGRSSNSVPKKGEI